MLNKVISWGLVDTSKNKLIEPFSTRKLARDAKRLANKDGKSYKIVRFQAVHQINYTGE